MKYMVDFYVGDGFVIGELGEFKVFGGQRGQDFGFGFVIWIVVWLLGSYIFEGIWFCS